MTSFAKSMTRGPEHSDEAKRARHGAGLRKERGKRSQGEIAEALGIDQAVISKAEKGRASEEVFQKLHRFYDLREALPGAPKDPIERQKYVDARSAAIQKVNAPAPR